MGERTRKKLGTNPRIDVAYDEICADAGGELNLGPAQRRLAKTVAKISVLLEDYEGNSSKGLQTYNSLLNSYYRGLGYLNIVKARHQSSKLNGETDLWSYLNGEAEAPDA